MQMHRLPTNIIAGVALALALTFTAQAQNARSFVATTGNDANNCSASAYCRTFAMALSVTNSGGEIVVVNSGGYGPFTISQPVTINAIGIDASVTQATSGQSAITVNVPTGNVTITGLNLFGGGTGSLGVNVEAVGVLRLSNMQVDGFGGGISIGSGSLALYDSKINDCITGLGQSGGQVYARNTEFDSNDYGTSSTGGTMIIADSSAHYNIEGFFANGGTLVLFNDRAILNAFGVSAQGAGSAAYFANSLISGNITNSFTAIGGATMFGSSPGTSLITPGQSSSGTLGTPITLQ